LTDALCPRDRDRGDLGSIIAEVRKANTFRNKALHNAFVGCRAEVDGEEIVQISLAKEKYNVRPEKRPYFISTAEFRDAAIANIVTGTTIQRWVLAVRPNAENRVLSFNHGQEHLGCYFLWVVTIDPKALNELSPPASIISSVTSTVRRSAS
jgi:hypothetical protein